MTETARQNISGVNAARVAIAGGWKANTVNNTIVVEEMECGYNNCRENVNYKKSFFITENKLSCRK